MSKEDILRKKSYLIRKLIVYLTRCNETSLVCCVHKKSINELVGVLTLVSRTFDFKTFDFKIFTFFDKLLNCYKQGTCIYNMLQVCTMHIRTITVGPANWFRKKATIYNYFLSFKIIVKPTGPVLYGTFTSVCGESQTSYLCTEDCICLATKIKNHKPPKNNRCDFVLDDCVLCIVEVCGFDPLLQDKCNPLYSKSVHTCNQAYNHGQVTSVHRISTSAT